ncbi:unnamed protein product [Arabidopsis lyrata]|uniref:Predicted protein n=1 Tax=Arabidopsis lyrata subsp. lyrata TaxID=81972 RepID=D7KB51_ARALL|nr:predicted protein [Arabidopsis lyrata subsp. lyrata]CAH8256666.1 unnamed protein product [Arabidopsis lyrata]
MTPFLSNGDFSGRSSNFSSPFPSPNQSVFSVKRIVLFVDYFRPFSSFAFNRIIIEAILKPIINLLEL